MTQRTTHEAEHTAESTPDIRSIRQPSIMLCIETSGDLCGIGLVDISSSSASASDGVRTPANTLLSNNRRFVPLAEISFTESFVHDRLLAEAVYFLCASAGISLSRISVVAVSSGPGSFTGLRIGAAFAKALCFEDGTETDIAPRLIAVPTMQAIAFAAREPARLSGKNRITVGIPSHKNLIYLQEFSAAAQPRGDIRLAERTELAAYPDCLYAGMLFTDTEFAEKGFSYLADYCRVTPGMIAALAAEMYAGGMITDPADFVPLYAQEFVPKTAPKS